MAGSVYTFVGTTNAKKRTAAIYTSQGLVKLGQSGLFIPSEVQEGESEGLDLVAGPAISPESQLTTPSVVAGSTGGLTGVFKYVVTFVTAAGETTPSHEATVTLSSQQGSISSIPLGDAQSGVIARKLYRTAAGGSSGTEKLVGTISDNTTTTATDNLADGSLGVVVPTTDTAGVLAQSGGSIASQANYAELTGNPSDDAFAISAGTGQKLSVSGGGGGRSIVTIAFSSAITPALPASDVIYKVGTLTGPITINNPSGTPIDGQMIQFLLAQDGTGSRVITWGGQFQFGTDVTTALIPSAASSKWRMLFEFNQATSTYQALAITRGF